MIKSATLEAFKLSMSRKLDAILNGDMTRSACGEYWIEKTNKGIEMSPAFAQLVLERLGDHQ